MKFKCEDVDKDYFLYAKGWYLKTNFRKDLTTIHSKWCGCPIEPHELGWCYERLMHLVCDIYKANGNFDRNFIDFVTSIAPHNCWQIGMDPKEKPYDHNEAVILKCLSVMRFVEVENLSNDDISDILPLKPFTEEII